ncbi:4353_t:CDS:2, partial [Gigaspora margarita]
MAKDKAYICFYNALERFANDLNNAKEATIKAADKLWNSTEVLSEVTNTGKRQRNNTGTA